MFTVTVWMAFALTFRMTFSLWPDTGFRTVLGGVRMGAMYFARRMLRPLVRQFRFFLGAERLAQFRE